MNLEKVIILNDPSTSIIFIIRTSRALQQTLQVPVLELELNRCFKHNNSSITHNYTMKLDKNEIKNKFTFRQRL